MIRMLIWSSNFTLKSLSLLVSVDSILQDLQALQRGMEGTKREFSVEKDNLVLQRFLNTNVELLNGLIADGKTAQVGFNYQNQNRKLSRVVSVDVRNRKYLSVLGWYFLPSFAGCLWLSCGVLRRKPQNNAALDVLPYFCQIHQSVQGQITDSCFADTHRELLHYTCSHQWLFIIWHLKHCFCVCQQAELDIEQRNKQHEAPLTPPKPEVMGNKVGTINSQCRKSVSTNFPSI